VGASYEAVVLSADRTAVIHRLKHLAENTSMSFYAYRVADRGIVVFGWTEGNRHWGPVEAEVIEDLAKELSRTFAKAVAVHFDDMFQVQESTLYQDGESIRSFGEEDELWAPTAENGEVAPDAPRCPGNAVPGDEEYALVWDGIDAGLEAAGFRSWLPEGGLLDVSDQDNLIWERSGVTE
jgi:hypothetical protein